MKIHIPFIIGLAFLSALPGLVRATNAGATTSMSVRIETATTTLWNGSVEFLPCSPSGLGTSTANGYCAVEATGIPTTWSSFGSDYFLESAGGAANNPATGAYWGWFADDVYGQTALTSHTVVNGERLLLALGIMPLKIVLATSTPEIGSTTTVSVYEFGFDSSWNGVWTPSASSTVYSGQEALCTNISAGICDVLATSTMSVYATKTGFATSSPQILYPTDVPTTQPAASSGSGGSPANVAPAAAKIPNISAAVSFLYSKQQSDGSFPASMYTDWAAIALSPYSDNRKSALTSFMRSYSPDISSVTDCERHAMALMSLGIDPYSGSPLNCIARITESFDGSQIGDKNLINDDVFAIFPLLKAGYSESDDIVYKAGLAIVAAQMNDGSWNSSIDMTSAAVAALSNVRTISGADAAISNARAYLVGKQAPDGGFGSVFSTAWVAQAVASLGEDASSWKGSAGKSIIDYLAEAQTDDGGFEQGASEGTRAWATSYVIPAISGRSWMSLLSSFPKPQQSAPTISVVREGAATASSTTITVATATSAPAEIIITATTPHYTETVPTTIQISAPSPEIARTATVPSPSQSEKTIDTTGSDTELLASVAASDIPLPHENIVLNSVLGVIALSGISYLVFKI